MFELERLNFSTMKLIKIALGFPLCYITKPDPFPPDEHAHESQGQPHKKPQKRKTKNV